MQASSHIYGMFLLFFYPFAGVSAQQRLQWGNRHPQRTRAMSELPKGFSCADELVIASL